MGGGADRGVSFARRNSTAPLRPRLTPEQSRVVVSARLQAYADRGVFRGFSEQRPIAGRYRFRFSWLAPIPHTLHYTPATGTFTFRNLLPNVVARSALHRDLQAFVAGRASPRLPPHRRVDRRRARIRTVLRRGAVSVELVATKNHHEYGVNRVVNLAHEIFLYLHEYQPEYMWKNFDVSED